MLREQVLLQRYCVLGRVNAGRSMFRDEHMNSYTIFKSAQLFERFGAFQRSWFPFHELEQHLAAESVDTLMAQIFHSRKIARVWDGGAREIERAPRKIDNNFHLMRRGRFRRIVEWMRHSDDVDPGIARQFFDEFVDQPRID